VFNSVDRGCVKRVKARSCCGVVTESDEWPPVTFMTRARALPSLKLSSLLPIGASIKTESCPSRGVEELFPASPEGGSIGTE
jgi:hypothetical protein